MCYLFFQLKRKITFFFFFIRNHALIIKITGSFWTCSFCLNNASRNLFFDYRCSILNSESKKKKKKQYI